MYYILYIIYYILYIPVLLYFPFFPQQTTDWFKSISACQPPKRRKFEVYSLLE